MFDIAWSELFVILIVALVVVGPKDLPKLMRTAGQWAGRARAMADQFRRSFDDMARQTELDELRQEVSKLKTDALKPMTDLDYKSFGINEEDFPTQATIEDVGIDPTKPVTADSAPAAAPPAPSLPATHEEAVAASTPVPHSSDTN
jgi:sec-independent protein translocase protein TatB